MKPKQIKTNLPLVAIVGRTNVGKSTLFNKFIETQKALVSKIAGTTRDLNFGICNWQGKEFEVVDTGGIFEQKIKNKKINEEKSITEQVEIKARKILEKADLILFVVDAHDEILKDDRLIADWLKKNFVKPQKKLSAPSGVLKDKKKNKEVPKGIGNDIKGKNVLMVINKIDKTQRQTPEIFNKLGIKNSFGISSTSGSGIGDLLDGILTRLRPINPNNKSTKLDYGGQEINLKFRNEKPVRCSLSETKAKEDQLRVSIIGKPNVGKSSLLNSILGEERVIVSAVPHTTREPQDTLIEFENEKIELVDTAGIRRKNKIRKESLEKSGISMSIKKLKESDIILFVIDISKNLSAQDAQLAGLIVESGISVIVVANKYDLLETDKETNKELTNYVHRYFPFLTWAPIIFVSAKSGRNSQKILPLMLEIKKIREKKIDKTELNEFVRFLMKKMPPPRQPRKKGSPKKSRAYISKIKQVDTSRPIFEIYVTNITIIPETYMRYLENNLRKRFEFDGTPLKLRVVREKK